MSGSTDRREEVILSIDAGTQSIRAALIDLAGEIRRLVKRPIEPYFSEHPGWAEQRPEYYWEQLCKTCLELLAGAAALKSAIQGVTLTTQRGTMVNVDRDGAPLRPAMVWLDQRKAEARGRLLPLARPALKALGYQDLVEGVLEDCEARWIQQHQPDVWEKTHKFLFLSGYFTKKLVDRFVDSSANVFGYVPLDIKRGSWAGPRDIKWVLFPIEPDKLPELVAPGEVLGHITPAASRETGIPEGLPLVAAASDKACELLGSSCLSPETACVSFGTTCTFNTMNRRYVELRPLWPPFPAALPGHYCTEVAVLRGAWMISWFREEFGLQERLEAARQGEAPEVLLDRLIRDVPAGAQGLTLLPHWMPGPGFAACSKGAIIGFGDVHTRAHLYRAILEGLVYALYEGAQLTQKRTRVPIRRVMVSGGGSQSDVIMQIVADVFGLPAIRSHTHETSALGAAIDAAVGLKLYPDFDAAAAAMTRAGRTFEPIEAHQKIYRALFEQVYVRIYDRLLPLFRRIKEITGYPG